MHYLPKRGGGGGLRIIDFKIVCFKSNSTTFYRSLGMRNQVETQKERSQGKSFSKILCIICLDGRSENNRFQNKSLQIQFYHVLLALGVRNQVEKQKEGSQETSIQ